jgi:hypothetical protein
MRYAAMQVLTWGTIAGAIGSALLMASLEGFPARDAVDAPTLAALPAEPTQAGLAAPPAAALDAASAPRLPAR